MSVVEPRPRLPQKPLYAKPPDLLLPHVTLKRCPLPNVRLCPSAAWIAELLILNGLPCRTAACFASSAADSIAVSEFTSGWFQSGHIIAGRMF